METSTTVETRSGLAGEDVDRVHLHPTLKDADAIDAKSWLVTNHLEGNPNSPPLLECLTQRQQAHKPLMVRRAHKQPKLRDSVLRCIDGLENTCLGEVGKVVVVGEVARLLKRQERLGDVDESRVTSSSDCDWPASVGELFGVTTYSQARRTFAWVNDRARR